MIVRGEECARSTTLVVMQVFYNGASNGEAIIGAGAPSYLVEDYQAARCSVVQDIGCLDHLNHEGTLPRCQVVLRAYAREDAINQADAGRLCGDVAANLCHQRNQRDLAQVG